MAEFQDRGEVARAYPAKPGIVDIGFGQLDGWCRRGHPPSERSQSHRYCMACLREHARYRREGGSYTQSVPWIRFTAKERLRSLGVLWPNPKHIPGAYLAGSIQQRLDLMRGLVDSDGTVTQAGRVQIQFSNRRLAEGTLDLALSLGYRATLRRVKLAGIGYKTPYAVGFVTTDRVALLPRKAERVPRAATSKTTHRSIAAVDEVASVPVRCITVAAEDGMFLAGRAHIP